MLHIYLVLSCQWTERKEDYGEGTCQDVDDEGSKNDTLFINGRTSKEGGRLASF